jgi:mannosyltransferase
MAKHKKKSAYAQTNNEESSTSDLDNGYISGISSYKDLTSANIKDALLHSRYAQIVIALTVIGLFLRFYNLTFNSIWLDEASTYIFSRGSFADIWQYMLTGDYNPPLFQFFVHFMLMFGNNEFTLRVVPAVAGVLTIPMMYLVGKEFIDRNVGIIAAAATTVSPFLIFYSQESRAYTLMMFFVAVEFYFWLKAMKSDIMVLNVVITTDIKNWFLFGLFAALAFWTHFYTLVFTALLFIFTLIVFIPKIRYDIRNIKSIVIAAGVLVVTTLPILYYIIPLYLKRTASAPTYGIQGFEIVTSTITQLSGYNGTLAMFFVALFVVGTAGVYFTSKTRAVLLVWLLTGLFAVSVFMSYRIPMLPRYLIFLSIILFVGIASTYLILYSLFENKNVVYLLTLLMLVSSITFLPGYYTTLSKDDWRGFSKTLEQVTKPGDVLVLAPGYNSQPLDYYYSNVTDGTIEVSGASADDFNSITAPPGNTVFFIVTGDISAANPNGDAVAWLNQMTSPVTQRGGIYLLARKNG